jgi:hypothetical protein
VPVIVKHDQIQAVKDALASVKSNGQALAACDAALKAAKDLGKHLHSEGGAIREGAAKNLDEYAKRVEVVRKPMAGAANAAVSDVSWAKAREQVMNLYMLAFTLETTLPPGYDFGDGWGPALSYAVKELPETIGKAVAVATKAATAVVTTAAKVSGSLILGVLKGTWPLLLVVGAGAIVFLVAKQRLGKAVGV